MLALGYQQFNKYLEHQLYTSELFIPEPFPGEGSAHRETRAREHDWLNADHTATCPG